jgi:hypothetical protein
MFYTGVEAFPLPEVFGNKMQKRLFVTKTENVTQERIKMHKEELN